MMEKDNTPYILTVILILLGIAGIIGISNEFQARLDRKLEISEQRWESAVEKKKEKRQLWCVNYVSAWSANLGLKYDPEVVMGVYKECVR